MKKKLPKFKSEKEMAKFWDTHSPLDYPDEFKEIKDPFEFNNETKKHNLIIGARVKKYRKKRKMTQAQLAQKIRIHRPNVARIESGRHSNSLCMLMRVADALKIPVWKLVIKPHLYPEK